MEKLRIKIKRTNILILALAIATAFTGCKHEDKKPEKTATAHPDSVNVVSGYGRTGSSRGITSITPQVSGVVDKIVHDEGDTLQTGDTIFILNHDDIRIQIAQQRAAMQAAKLAADITAEKITTAEKTLETRKRQLKRVQNAFDAGTESQQNLDNARLSYEEAEGNLKTMRLTLKQQQNQYEAEVQRLRGQQLNLAHHFVKSPGNGVLLSLDTELNDPVQALQSAGTFRFSGPWKIEAEIDELFARQVKVGMPATALPYGLNDTLARGTVTRVAPQLRQKSMFSESSGGFQDRRVRVVEITINKAYQQILPGQRVNVFIHTK